MVVTGVSRRLFSKGRETKGEGVGKQSLSRCSVFLDLYAILRQNYIVIKLE